MVIDTTFSHTYQFRLLTQLPNSPSLPRYYYPGASRISGHDGVIIEFGPEHGEPWIGIFEFGRVLVPGITGIFTTPQSHQLCVVSQSEGYLISADDPTIWENIQIAPILDVRPLLTQQLLLFTDFQKLAAYGKTGLQWIIKDLVTDDLKITTITDTHIIGEGWFGPDDAEVRFRIDLTTRQYERELLHPRIRSGVPRFPKNWRFWRKR